MLAIICCVALAIAIVVGGLGVIYEWNWYQDEMERKAAELAAEIDNRMHSLFNE